ncbi:DUF998 domain-containing protein [Stutzerimonas kirkiae]|uniref:DUF998 domain-containing protein n=1 Tax=Stutzerimonas kirkiae TaxID=2211392 RepID=A0A4Q9R3D5_9GAMM|nr:DUF998 domain-containing protein [Stutzerimonas kirkiae]TBU92852.1 DUF998 domain-containing protein [Stutzerimonas kirkiae]TBV01315.1 DUF998 domain-containing protein [Stutzerimonas kirkiae]TBV10780.1 DUF998 domain-containing protein [Stutzerimonas kirkiae]TBV14567.1 DUF998 domain-containing protein [Stutzerimonas kirkiae]
MRKYGFMAGVLIPFWLALGVMLAGALYPGYSHVDQAMSELGALGAPTHGISPLINNYPLGVLFVLFGLALWLQFGNLWSRATAVLVMLHGLASFATGYYACDVGCSLERPSSSQNLHNLAGFVMFLSLLLASFIWIFLAQKLLGSRVLSLLSVAAVMLAVLTMPLMAQAVEAGQGFGLYQRLNYGVQVLWVAALALTIWWQSRRLSD